MERPGATTFKGTPLTLVGPELKVGQTAPDFDVVDNALQPVNLQKTGRSVRIFSVIPSLDTPVCDAQTKRFNDALPSLNGIEVYTVSMDLPFGQKRWCNQFGIDNVKMLSDHRGASFGEHYGVLVKEWRVLSRAIFVLDKDNVLRHVEYVREVADHPNYEAAVNAAKALAG